MLKNKTYSNRTWLSPNTSSPDMVGCFRKIDHRGKSTFAIVIQTKNVFEISFDNIDSTLRFLDSLIHILDNNIEILTEDRLNGILFTQGNAFITRGDQNDQIPVLHTSILLKRKDHYTFFLTPVPGQDIKVENISAFISTEGFIKGPLVRHKRNILSQLSVIRLNLIRFHSYLNRLKDEVDLFNSTKAV